LAVTLPDEQLDAFEEVMREEGVRWDDMASFRANVTLFGNREILRACGSLLPAQRQALLAGQAVDDAQLPPAARRWLQRAWDQRRRSLAGNVALAGAASGGQLRLARGAVL